jgi:DNA-binding NtrC family response regulator
MRIERITSEQVASPRILVVDDDPAIRRLFVTWLTASGHSVRTASDAFEAVDVLRGEVVGAMICDIKMPLYDGNWLIEEVADAHPCLPIIVVTGVPETDRQVTRRPSVIRHVAKPVEREELSAAVDAAFEWRARQQLPVPQTEQLRSTTSARTASLSKLARAFLGRNTSNDASPKA